MSTKKPYVHPDLIHPEQLRGEIFVSYASESIPTDWKSARFGKVVYKSDMVTVRDTFFEGQPYLRPMFIKAAEVVDRLMTTECSERTEEIYRSMLSRVKPTTESDLAGISKDNPL